MKNFLNSSLNRNYLRKATLALVGLFLSSTALAEPAPVIEDHLSIGAGGIYNSSAYDGYNGFTTAMPFFSFHYGRLFGSNQHDEPTIGWEIFQHKRVMLAFAATSGRTFLDVGEINDDRKFLYYGIEDRDRAVEVGLIFHYYSRVGLFEAKTFHDVISTYGGTRSSLSISRPFPDTGNWSVVPRFFIKHYSEKFNRYYYGVSETENTTATNFVNDPANSVSGSEQAYYNTGKRAEYQPGNSGHVGVDLSIEYNFSEDLKGIGYVGIEKFSGEIETSPLIEDKELVTTSLGLRYNF